MARRLSYEDSAVIHELKTWGFHHGKAIAWEGYSVESTISRLLQGWGGSFEHRVLCKDPPAKYWRINAKVQKLPLHLIAVLIARYCVPPKQNDDGSITYHSRKDLARACGISEHEFRKRLRLAKAAYKRLIFAPRQPLYGVV